MDGIMGKEFEDENTGEVYNRLTKEDLEIVNCRIIVINMDDTDVHDANELTPDTEAVEVYTYKAPRLYSTTYGRGVLFEHDWAEYGSMSKAEILNDGTGEWE